MDAVPIQPSPTDGIASAGELADLGFPERRSAGTEEVVHALTRLVSLCWSQSCAWFSAVDLDHVLRKEVNMDCTTPSQPTVIPHGVSQTIEDTLKATNDGSLFKDGRTMQAEADLPLLRMPTGHAPFTPSAIEYRRKGWEEILFLEAQNAATKSDLQRTMSRGLDWDIQISADPKPRAYRRRGSTSSTSDSDARNPSLPKSRTPPMPSVASQTQTRTPLAPIVNLPLRRAPEAKRARNDY